ncbi:MAG: DUF1961 family protein [bacterium]|nr:DUF1961 family protein [bacterium]
MSCLKINFYFAAYLVVMLIGLNCQKQERQLKSAEELVALRDSMDLVEQRKTGKNKAWGNSDISGFGKVIEFGETIFEDNFQNFDNWVHEGRGELTQPTPEIMQINCIGSAQGGVGCMAFCKPDFPNQICIEYDLRILTTNGLLINFIACQGRQGEDMLADLPPRKGVFADYVFNSNLRSYHFSVSRYDDDGVHTGFSNWRRNPGLFLMAQQPDLCKQPDKWYHIKIVKSGGFLKMTVNDQLAGGFIDLEEIPDQIPGAGKLGFRAIGSNVIVQIKNFRVRKILEKEMKTQ